MYAIRSYYANSLCRPCTGEVGINWLINGLTFLQFFNMINKKVEFQRLGMVKIYFLPDLHWKMAAVFIITILRKKCNFVV